MPAPITEYQVNKISQQIRQTEQLRRVCGQISLDTLSVKLDIGAHYCAGICEALRMDEKEIVRHLSCALAELLRGRLMTSEMELKKMLNDPSWEKDEDYED